MKRLAAILVLGLLAASAMTQTADMAALQTAGQTVALGSRPAASSFSLLDLSRIRFSHSYSMGYYSGSGQSFSTGMLNSTMFYDISSKLSLAVNVGVLHNTGAIWGQRGTDATILPGFRLDYHPSSKFSMALEVQTYSGMMPYSGRYGWWRYPW